MVQDRSVLGALEELRVADASGAQRLDEEIGAVNTSFSKQLETEIATKDGQIANLRSEIGEQIANLPSSLTELRAEVVKKDQQIANLTADLEGFRRNTTKDIRELKACVCVQKPAPLFALSSQVLYPTSYTYPEAHETRPLIPVPGYNPSKSQFDIIDISSHISINQKYSGGVLAPNGHIYMVPFLTDSIGDFDPSTNTFGVIDISSRISIDGKYNGGVLAPNGHIYMVPRNADSIGSLTPGNSEPAYDVGGGVPEEWRALLSPHFNKL